MEDLKNPYPDETDPVVALRNYQRASLTHELDELLERYLRTLDEYEKVTKELSQQLSSGYLSLAQANFHNSSSTIRYGKDCYDERMQAIRKVNITDEGSEISHKRAFFSILPEQKGCTSVKGASVPQDQEAEEEEPQLFRRRPRPTETSEPKATPAADSEKNTKEEKESTPNSSDTKEPPSDNAKLTDPLRWFGILVPPALRTAQSTFVAAVEGPLAHLATVTRDMRNQEIEVGRLRKQIKKL